MRKPMEILKAISRSSLFIRMAFPCLLCLFPSLAQAAIESLPEEHQVYRQVQAIYERLVPAFGEGRLPPRLVVAPTGAKTREAIASSGGGNEGSLAFEAGSGMLAEGYVAIEERTVAALADLGADRDNAIAFLLSHELAHVYLRHGWVGDFGNSFARTEMGRKMMKAATYEEVVKRETEADHFGAFYGYLAGYDTLGVAPRALEKIYTAFALAEQIPNYPAKTERIAIARRQMESLNKLVPVYEAGTRLLILGRYEEAGRLFAHLARIFPSREMFNNAGVAFALEAVRLLPPKSMPYVYPFELDAETRLLNHEQQGQRAARAGQEDDQSARRLRLLRRSLSAFEQAIRRDNRYATATVNSAAVQSLLGNQDDAIRLAGSALATAREGGERVTVSHAMVVRGIALARSGDAPKARSELEAARQIVPDLVATNIAALDGRAVPTLAATHTDAPAKTETIAGYPAKEAFVNSGDKVSFTLTPAEKGESQLALHSRRGKDWNSIAIELEGRRIGTLVTDHTYKGSTANGVRIGSPLASLGQLYGSADRIVPSRQGAWYVYNTAGIVFEVNDLGKVAGWFIFTLR
jgi:tetratricopeptide (TPR) repeat protein